MKQKMETSKKLLLVTGLIFAFVVFVCLCIFVYCTLNYVSFDWTGIVTLLTVAGSVFGTTIATYSNKAKLENVYKIKRSFLREKYEILKELGMLDQCRVQMEIESEISQIDYQIENAEMDTATDTAYQQIM